MVKKASHDGMDPELAALLGTAGSTDGPLPDFSDIFGEKIQNDFADISSASGGEVDLAASGFPQITKRLEDKGHNLFNDPNYYKTALSNEGDIAQRVHSILQKYLTSKDPKDRSVFRQQLIPQYWEFLFTVARKAAGNFRRQKNSSCDLRSCIPRS